VNGFLSPENDGTDGCRQEYLSVWPTAGDIASIADVSEPRIIVVLNWFEELKKLGGVP
jgi:hypothetical protein